MFAIQRTIRKLYYEHPDLYECTARVVRADEGRIELDQTIAYPERRRQDSDRGIIVLPNDVGIRFIHARKMYGNRAPIPDSPDIQLGGIIEHIAHPDDVSGLCGLLEGTAITVRIDRLRRAQLSLSHTASHLIYLAVGKIRPNAIDRTLGCHIRTDAAHFDFGVAERFTTDEVAEIERLSNQMMSRGSEVRVFLR